MAPSRVSLLVVELYRGVHDVNDPSRRTTCQAAVKGLERGLVVATEGDPQLHVKAAEVLQAPSKTCRVKKARVRASGASFVQLASHCGATPGHGRT